MPIGKLAPRIGLALSWLAMAACGPEMDLRSETSAPIFGGHSAPHANYGWFASLWDEHGIWSDYRNCGGSLIASQWVLTAAHCVDGGVDYVEIGPTDATERLVLGIFSHPSMDVALLLISPPSTAEPIALNLDPGFPAAISIFIPTADRSLTTAGFGAINANGDPSDDLLEIHIPALTNDSCAEVYEAIDDVEDSEICAGIWAGGVASCHGDSGGALFAWTGAGQTAVGVTSWSNPFCGLAMQPAVYARVSAAASWIASIAAGARFVSPAALIGAATPIII